MSPVKKVFPVKSMLLAGAFVALPLAASAATFDFGALGSAFDDEFGFEGSWDEVTDWVGDTPGTWVVDGIGVTATTSSNYVHADSDWRLGPDSGIGPCGIDDCNANDEDGFGPGETITLTFSEPVSMTSLLLRQSDQNRSSDDPDHTPAQGSFTLDSAVRSVVDGVAQGSFGSGVQWVFGYGGSDPSDYYINTAVVEAESGPPPGPPPSVIPLPASALLLGAALGGLGLMRRRTA